MGSAVWLLLVLMLVAGVPSRRMHHQFWLTASKTTVHITDRAWSYCDEKCLYLEQLAPNKDFVVIYFKDKTFKPNFAGCYVKHSNHTYSLWNTAINNTFYDKLCGGDKDWLSYSNYKIASVEGKGIGTPLSK